MITDEQIIYDALRLYALQRHSFVEYAYSKDAKKENGEAFTEQEQMDAMRIANRCEQLVETALERVKKMQSPIIRVN